VLRWIAQWFLRWRKVEKGISIICVYNNRKKLNDYLIQSLNKQTVSFELLTIDNTAGDFRSAARILNETARKAKYKYLMFVHQDVEMDSNDWLANAQRDLDSLYRLGAAGVVGISEQGLASSVFTGDPAYFVGTERLYKPVQVQTLDGCLMIVPRRIFKRISFDETTIEGWYFYAVDYCLDLIRLGYRIYVLPCKTYHESPGPHDPSVYEKTLKKILEKHRNHIEMIYSTMGVWKT